MAKIDLQSEIIGTVWKIEKSVGDKVSEGETIMILESMKMEIPVESPASGTLVEILIQPEDSIDEDQILCVIET